jgi:hypothetical protein
MINSLELGSRCRIDYASTQVDVHLHLWFSQDDARYVGHCQGKGFSHGAVLESFHDTFTILIEGGVPHCSQSIGEGTIIIFMQEFMV